METTITITLADWDKMATKAVKWDELEAKLESMYKTGENGEILKWMDQFYGGKYINHVKNEVKP